MTTTTKKNDRGRGARRHSVPQTLGGYENQLVRMIEKRTGAEFDEYLLPQVQACAQCWMMLTKVHRELSEQKLTSLVEGSKGQQKEEVTPLLPWYLKLQAELRLQFQSLGLNWNATPSKIKEDTRKGVDETDPMAQFYKGGQG